MVNPSVKPVVKAVEPLPPKPAPPRERTRRRNEPPVTPPPTVVAPALEPMDPEPTAAASDSAGIERLHHLAFVWHTVSLHHPAVVRGAPWDSAFVRAATRVRSASNPDSLASAYSRLFAALGDPVTRVEPVATPAPDAAPAAVRVERLRDSIVWVQIPSASVYVSDAAATVRAALTASSSRVILDLRTPAPGAELALVEAFAEQAQLGALLTDVSFNASSARSRRVGGAQPAGDGVLPDDGWWQRDGRFTRAIATTPRRVVILANRYSVIPRTVTALVATERATLIAEDGLDETPLVASVLWPIGGGRSVRLRTSELVHPDGSVGLVADTTLPAAVQATDSAPALRTAITLLRTGRVVRAPRLVPVAQPSSLPAVYNEQEPYPFLGARLLAGVRVWSALRARHAHRDLYDDDIDELFLRTIPALEAARYATQYAAALRLLTGAMADAQAAVRGASVDSVIGVASAPFRVRWIEDRAIITDVIRDSLTTALALSPGMEVTAADGYPLPAWITDRRGLVSAPNQWTRQRLLMQELPLGPGGSALFKVRDAMGRERQLNIPRRASYVRALPVWSRPDAPAVRTLPGGVTYVDLERLGADTVRAVLEAARSARGWLLDLRGHEVHEAVQQVVLAAVRRVPAAVALREVHRYVTAPCMTEVQRDVATQCASTRDERARLTVGDTARHFAGRLVVLIDERTQGASERLALALEAVAPVTFVGSASAGSPAEPYQMSVPGLLTVSVPLAEIRRADGGQVQRVGITPLVELRPTVRGVRNAQDDVLDRAQQWLVQQLDPPVRRRR